MLRIYLLLLCFMTGCGTCGQIARQQNQFGVAQSQAKSNGLPQIRVDVPAVLVNRWFDERVKALPGFGLELKGLSELQRVLGRVEVRPRRIVADIKTGRDSRFDVDLDVFMNQRIIFSLRFKLDAPVVIDPKASTIEISFNAQNLKSLKPTLTGNAKSNLTSNLMRIMPAILRPVFLRKQVEEIVGKALKLFEKDAARLLAKQILAPMGEFARVRLQLPELPIERVVVEANQARWSFGIYTSLSGPGIRPLIRRGNAEVIQVGFGGDTLARLINWSMARGKLPNRFDVKGRAQPDGPFSVGFKWMGGKRPLGFQLWCTDSERGCLHVRASAALRPRLHRGQLKLELKDARIEHVEGDVGSALPLEFMRIAGHSFDLSRKISASTRLSLGRGEMDLSVTDALLSSDVFVFQLTVASKP